MSDGRLLGKEELRRLFPDAERAAQATAALIGSALPPGYGFALLVFSYGDGGYLTHVSSCEREDLVNVMRECAEKLSQGPNPPPGIVGQRD